MTITKLKQADSLFPADLVCPNGKKNTPLPIIFAFYLIEDGEKKILVDVGADTIPGFELIGFQTPIELLAEEGLTPDDITDVIITHCHNDHMDALHHFPKATLYIQELEAQDGAHYIPEGMKVVTFAETYDFSDKIRLVKIGTHSRGCTIVEIKQGDKILVLCSDECTSRYNLERLVPIACSNDRERNLAFLKKYSDPKYECLILHEAAYDDSYNQE